MAIAAPKKENNDIARIHPLQLSVHQSIAITLTSKSEPQTNSLDSYHPLIHMHAWIAYIYSICSTYEVYMFNVNNLKLYLKQRPMFRYSTVYIHRVLVFCL